MADKKEQLDFIGVNKIVLQSKTKEEDFERAMREEVFTIPVADMVFRDGSRAGDNKLYRLRGDGDSREYLWTTSYFRSSLRGFPNPDGAKMDFEGLARDAKAKIKKFGKLTPLGVISLVQEK
jgi:hypothetical protein